MTELSLVERLRERAYVYDTAGATLAAQDLREAADALAEQAAVREELYEALQEMVAAEDAAVSEWNTMRAPPWPEDNPVMQRLARARAALAKAAPEKGEAE